jgi:hypothetical protein
MTPTAIITRSEPPAVKYVATFMNGAGIWRRTSKREYTHAWAVYTTEFKNGLGGGGFAASYVLARKAADTLIAKAHRNNSFKASGSEIVPAVRENPRGPLTIAEAHAAGAADGRQGLGAVPPRDSKLKAAYMQSYRDNLVARVGIPERRKNPRIAKDPGGMGAAQINRELDRLDVAGSKITTELIAAGRGTEKILDTIKQADPVALRLRANLERTRALRNEIERRYGPGAPSRLPRGFGPIRGINPRVRRKSNRRPGPALVVLYASRPGSRRLKYLGRGKFGERGRPMLFKTAAHARIAAGILRDSYPEVLRRWTLKAGT